MAVWPAGGSRCVRMSAGRGRWRRRPALRIPRVGAGLHRSSADYRRGPAHATAGGRRHHRDLGRVGHRDRSMRLGALSSGSLAGRSGDASAHGAGGARGPTGPELLRPTWPPDGDWPHLWLRPGGVPVPELLPATPADPTWLTLLLANGLAGLAALHGPDMLHGGPMDRHLLAAATGPGWSGSTHRAMRRAWWRPRTREVSNPRARWHSPGGPLPNPRRSMVCACCARRCAAGWPSAITWR